MVYLTRKARFSAGHRYYLDELSADENRRLFGRCARPHGHGHDYVLQVTVGGAVDPLTGMVVNITDLKRVIEDEVVLPLDGAYITPPHPLVAGRVPCTEALARGIWDRLAPAFEDRGLRARLENVSLAECRTLRAECSRGRESPVVTLTRTYEFAAAHRLHAAGLSEDSNRELYGKCNNPHGHGHNYVLEVTVGGEPDPRTGFITDLGTLDGAVREQVVDRYDHHHLNLDLPEFHDLNPTSENLVRVIWERLEPALPPGLLRRVVIRETERNVFTYEGGPK